MKLLLFAVIVAFVSCSGKNKTNVVNPLIGMWTNDSSYISINDKGDTVYNVTKNVLLFKNDSLVSFGNAQFYHYTIKDSILKISGNYIYKIQSLSDKSLVLEELNNPFYMSDEIITFTYRLKKVAE